MYESSLLGTCSEFDVVRDFQYDESWSQEDSPDSRLWGSMLYAPLRLKSMSGNYSFGDLKGE